MALIPDRTLETVTAADIPGAETAPVSSVREIRRSPTALLARMKDARVTVSADFEEAECTACPTTPCPHFSAALLAWVRKRVPVREPRRLGLVDRLLSSPGWKNADHFASDYFKGAAGEVDVKADGSSRSASPRASEPRSSSCRRTTLPRSSGTSRKASRSRRSSRASASRASPSRPSCAPSTTTAAASSSAPSGAKA